MASEETLHPDGAGVDDVIAFAKDRGCTMLDIRFMDLPGLWQHYTFPIKKLDADLFEEGLPFDGSSLRGWKTINESDMLVVPDAQTAFIDPFMAEPTLVLIGNIVDPIERTPYGRCPRSVAARAEAYLKSTGIGDTINFGPEAEFFIFDDVRFRQTTNMGFYEVDSVEGSWNTDRFEDGGNLGYKPRTKQGYFPVPPMDSLHDLRTEMLLTLAQLGCEPELHHHEVASGGQCELSIRFNTLTRMADQLMMYKYVVKNVAREHGKTATFMPKPLFGDNGSGMHCHSSIWKEGKNQYAGDGYAGLSKTAIYAIGGILKHAAAILAITNPTTNSYHRLVPGYEAPVNLAYSSRNRSACVRIPITRDDVNAKRFEFRCPDPSCNPYLAFSAITMAALDGIQNKIDPGQPMDKDLYDLPPEQLKEIPQTPGSLEESLRALENDHEFLLKGDVFSKDIIEEWISYKMTNEVQAMRLRPHPHEFELYFDI
ncbi:MAG: type I glutamate--ammonia ligase [Planctomycetes bacterium]|nr:type I glutamate--ammonia ligase [Planctomycetota bacterium]